MSIVQHTIHNVKILRWSRSHSLTTFYDICWKYYEIYLCMRNTTTFAALLLLRIVATRLHIFIRSHSLDWAADPLNKKFFVVSLCCSFVVVWWCGWAVWGGAHHLLSCEWDGKKIKIKRETFFRANVFMYFMRRTYGRSWKLFCFFLGKVEIPQSYVSVATVPALENFTLINTDAMFHWGNQKHSTYENILHMKIVFSLIWMKMKIFVKLFFSLSKSSVVVEMKNDTKINVACGWLENLWRMQMRKYAISTTILS